MTPTSGDERGEHVEWVEWVDEHDRVIEVVTRPRMRADNLRHRSAAVVVLSTDGRLLVHRRADTKDLRPGWWDVCVGGVVSVGETYEETAIRELAEEIGVVGARLEHIGDGRWDDVDSMEFSRIFRTVHDGPYVFADGEVAEARLVTSGELWLLMGTERFLPASRAMILPLVDGFEPPDA